MSEAMETVAGLTRMLLAENEKYLDAQLTLAQIHAALGPHRPDPECPWESLAEKVRAVVAERWGYLQEGQRLRKEIQLLHQAFEEARECMNNISRLDWADWLDGQQEDNRVQDLAYLLEKTPANATKEASR